jgi:1-acyl-sn-glycerol-3-phosphate acyltransferase
MTNFDGLSSYDPYRFVINLPNVLACIGRIPFTKGIPGAKKLIAEILKMNNVTIRVKGYNKLAKLKKIPKVFICNHTSIFDFMVLFYILETGFLSSSAVNENIISRQLTNIIPVLIIERGKNVNTVEKMKQYVKKNGSICLFPEGMHTYPDTIIRFRTGAFYIGYPIYPIVLKYNTMIADASIGTFILKVTSGTKIDITMEILDPWYPPFNDDKIESVRLAMAKAGKMALSRVSNRDIVDKKS